MSKKPKPTPKPPLPSSGGSYVAEGTKLKAVAGPKAAAKPKPAGDTATDKKGS